MAKFTVRISFDDDSGLLDGVEVDGDVTVSADGSEYAVELGQVENVAWRLPLGPAVNCLSAHDQAWAEDELADAARKAGL